MADDSSSLSTDKPVVESSSASSSIRSSSGGRGGGQSGFGKRQSQRKQESREDHSSETPVPVATSSPAKTTKGGPNNNKERRPSYSRDNREGRQKRGGGVGGRDREQGQRNKTVPSAPVENPSGESTSTFSGGNQQQEQSAANKKDTNKKKYAVRKRAPPKEDFEIKPNDVFVNEKSHFVAQLSKCKKLFEKGHREVFLHGLGKAIPRAINIAFELKNFYHNTVDYTVNTSTVQLFDDLVDIEDPDQPPSVRTRNVSSVDIKVYRSLNIP